MKAPKITPEILKALKALGSIGGKKRARNLSKERRAEIARKAAGVRWGKRRQSR